MSGGRSLVAPAVIIAIALFVPWIVGPYHLTVALTLCMWIALTQSWIVLSGMAGYVSLGHVVFYGLGAYTSVVTWKLLPLYVAIPLGGLVAGLFALLVGPPVLRVRGPYFVILTFGLAELVKFVVVNVETGLGQASRLLFGTPEVADLYYVMLGLAVAASLMAYFTRHSRLGRALLAIREDEEAAETIGIHVARYKVYAYLLSAVIPGMVGAVMALRSTYFEPLQVFSPVVSFTVVTMAIIGGSDDARGPLVGALFLVVLSELLWANAPQLYMIILGSLLVGFVLFAPQGIIGRLVARQKVVG
jgi:branched-chain amino acid transport system permease protein